MRPSTVAIVPVVACLALSGCAGWRSDSDEAKDKARPASGAIPAGAATAESDAAARANGRRDRPSAASATVDTSIPPLPEDVTLRTTDVELGTAALMAAQAEKDSGALGERTVADRHAQIYAAWRPQMLERQAFLQQLADQRKREADRQLADAGRIAKHQAELHATEARLKAEVEAERRKTAPILTREDRSLLE